MPNLDYVEDLPNGAYFHQFNNDIFSYSNYRSNVEWDNKWYWSDGVNTGKMLPDGTELPLGIATPTTALTQTEDGPGLLEGSLKYTYTIWSSKTNAESAPAPLPLYIRVSGNAVSLTGFEPLPDADHYYRLYRVGGYLTNFLMVAQFNTTTYKDNIDDTLIDGRPLYTLRSSPPPDFLENLTELNGRFYGSVGNKLYFSALGNPDSWYLSDYILFRDTIVALGSVPAGLLVMGKFYVNLLYGTQPENFKLKLISDQLGCIGKESVSYIGDACIWLSNRQLVMSNGYKITDITAYKMDRITGIYPTGAVSDNETYYLSYKPSLFPSDDLFPSDRLYPDRAVGVSGVDQGIIAVDFKRGVSFSYKIIEYENIRALGIVDSEICVSTGGYGAELVECDKPMYPNCNWFTTCTPFTLNRMNVYDEQGLTPLYYMSPFLTDNSLSTMKEYDKVRIIFKGSFYIKVLFDNGKVAVERPITSKDTGFILIGIPNKANKSYGIQFEIEGVGVVKSIQYSWKFREVIN